MNYFRGAQVCRKEFKLKVCVIGEVGKTSIVAKRVSDKFPVEYMGTQGVNYSRITSLVDGKEVCLDASFFFNIPSCLIKTIPNLVFVI